MTWIHVAVFVAGIVLAVVIADARAYARKTGRPHDRLTADTPVATRSDRVQAELYPLPPLEGRATTRRPPRSAA